ncbi:MAG: enoyl-CoA hydratase/isomerase family protein [Acidobacteria bacterium]|nr:enoyl-CoA hydratase/isomerase family protein [Acidobacteriota bacterium]
MAHEYLLVERDGSVLTIVLNRPTVLNALNARMIEELDDALADADADASIGAVVLTGAGDRAFSAGADLREIVQDGPAGAHVRARRAHAVFTRIERLRMPVIAAINGLALGGGCELALACALRLASMGATFGQPEIGLGLIPGYGATVRLPRLVGRGTALELLLTGEPIAADEAWRVGLVNRVVPAGDLRSAAHALAMSLAAQPRLAMRYLLEAVAAGLEMPADVARDHEATLFGLVCATDDMREGVSAFLDRRRPEYRGR